ncbi:2-succinyl-5-enolpyruvyl-6-hydroxy-3-cyclohexene-1-carboxylic-acid synthase [Pontibacter cellulosilyticus]|uniref:2-succinyl-5-enolpyruvyl-6-hydroxy-3-cyclohexene-1-carboxylate synthase n=1 Tax=Pontibacter cellulosilyticus TaxID=1720253 RepID=A0A923N409_9BACT|nr:2-succinyl-5-enolpyruvyl-6-hydroxy-3-cyclohexene-1-carboxylic-acid synthase [Pontibacter cellulosilyticus]MBC5991302.1 2-succinyl-5-enolpyruvyl-6-hydroxy-3-cyclohexene-1-carboxylic-acid synthase [Pontibacter cellulosilyticus]
MIIQPVVNIAEICARKGVENVVLSPGSRCAPLTIAFARHGGFKVRTVSDERAAAFIALGMALTTGKPAVLVCTSGTAALNYAPAVAEAYFQQVPLLVLTADRPTEWIDQLDGQTIRQQNVFGQHIKHSYTFPLDVAQHDAVWYSERMVSEALNETVAYPAGPVHINVPLREPFYPAPGEEVTYGPEVKVIEEETQEFILSQNVSLKLQEEILKYSRVVVVAGQEKYNLHQLQSLYAFSQSTGAVIVGDTISNIHEMQATVRYQDVFLACPDAEKLKQLQPDLLITFGKSVISKSLKQFLRKYKPEAHWHIQPAGQVADTFQALTKVVRCAAPSFFYSLAGSIKNKAAFTKAWMGMNEKAADFLQTYTSNAVYSELSVVAKVMQQLPSKSNLHLANSMAVRYANIIGLKPEQEVEVFANRGTSGIDGSTSTAVGCALSSTKINTLLTGDMAFFYDRNGLWHNYLPQNLRIIILNNHAGGIFRLIDGPKQQPELEPYFETKQRLNAENTARDFGMKYTAVNTLGELGKALPEFFTAEAGAGILEVFTNSPENAEVFEKYRRAVRSIEF